MVDTEQYQLELETIGWLAELGYTHLYGPEIAS